MNINPVLMKEIKVRMRGWRAAAIVVSYLAVLALVTLAVMYTNSMNIYTSIVDPQYSIGIYTALAIIQLVLILFIVPALTAGAISGEREKQTIDLLLCTKLHPWTIVSGKLLASMSQVILLIVASLPIFSVIFLFGGVSIVEVLELFGFYIVTAITIGSIGIFSSTFFKRTTAATVFTYAMVALLTIGTLIFSAFYMSMVYKYNYQKYFPLFYTNPLAGFGSLLSGQFGMYGGGGILNIVSGLNPTNQAAAKGLAPWIINMIFDVVFAVVLLLLSAIKINPIKRSRARPMGGPWGDK